MRSNGGLIGAKKTVSTSAASGIWAIRDAQREHGISNWPSGDMGAFESIATTTLSTATATVTFSSIPATYKHLQLRTLARNSGEFISIRATFNGDSTSVYTIHELYGNGASALAAAQTNIAYYPCGLVGPVSTTGVFGSAVTDILDYRSTDKFKTMRTLTGYDANGSGYVELTSGVWRSTSAITSITIVPNGGTLVQYSHLALYGIKG